VFARLLLLFILVPIAELYLFLTLGAMIGLWPTLGIIVLTALIGAWLTKSQGARAIARFQQALAEGRLPHREALDGILILVAGAMLLTPGFLTDTVGFLLLVPPVRAFLRGRLANFLKGRIQVVTPTSPGQPAPRNDDGFIDV
jgi:UPF0716 protein FxsA